MNSILHLVRINPDLEIHPFAFLQKGCLSGPSGYAARLVLSRQECLNRYALERLFPSNS
jgi:hypothetical protein